MKKYLSVISNSFQLYFTYRINFILWRVRVVLSILINYFLWQAVFFSRQQVFGYKKEEMITYIILMAFINGAVLSTQTAKIAEEINMGRLSNYLVKPINYFGFNLGRDIPDKIINTMFSILEIFIIIVLLQPHIFLQNNLFWLIIFFITVLLAGILYFEINMLLSFLSFWSREAWASRFIFFIIVAFLAGTYFPLDILPGKIYNLLLYLPFTYLVFFPIKIYLGGLNFAILLKGFLVIFVWIILLWLLNIFVWRKGLKSYTAEGL